MKDSSKGPLSGLRIIDIATVYAAPFAASLLGDYGAEVLKVELPGKGDPVRGFPPMEGEESLPWAAISRNKRAITLDLRKEKGQEIFLRLLKDQDLLFENFRPGTLDRWGLDEERLRAANPNLIIVHVSGYGQTGPYKKKAGFGTSATAFSGYTGITGYPNHPPLSPPISLADYVTGIFAALGAMAALYHRDAHDGDPQNIDIALYESMFRLLENDTAAYSRLGVVRERAGNELSTAVPVGTFQSADKKWLVLTASTDRTFYRLAELMGRADMKTDPRYSKNHERVKRRSEVTEIVSNWFSNYTAQEIQELCDKNGVPVSPIYSIDDIFQDPQYAARQAIVEVDHPSLGKVKLPGIVPKFSKTPGSIIRTGATLGEHNIEIYTDLGLSKSEINSLIKEGVI
ncbi:succinyl-CoA--D-citramalate CoA-transferase [Marinithermofilum abyssi]|uniref:Succinyl-CoA--D-citramalate CoA-transferase n=1 Tax=Marinithermofilum abyssi TaxID=1571185 RepID=A0A8J2VJC1_9BACL|nr:CaiB/BaiF CoA-transferase family protein [Marinithermofilum abyssi]GGE28542.1 succinyl-CoA--D-citramalate CoA-transferase [Marinithermofilum abyssi]